MTEPLLPRDLAVLRHVGLYRIGLYPILSHLFFGGSGPACGIAIKRLAETRGKRRALVELHSRALPGKLSYATLRPAGCAEVGVSAKRANPLGTAALNLAIGVSYFCCRGEHRRHRVERAELRRFFSDATPPENVLHVATDELGWPAVLRVYQIGPNVAAVILGQQDHERSRAMHCCPNDCCHIGSDLVDPQHGWPTQLVGGDVQHILGRRGITEESSQLRAFNAMTSMRASTTEVRNTNRQIECGRAERIGPFGRDADFRTTGRAKRCIRELARQCAAVKLNQLATLSSRLGQSLDRDPASRAAAAKEQMAQYRVQADPVQPHMTEYGQVAG